MIANDTIKMTDIILGTKWLRKHDASLNLKKEFTLKLNLKDKKGNWAKRELSLEPNEGRFVFNNMEEDIHYSVFTTKLLFNRKDVI